MCPFCLFTPSWHVGSNLQMFITEKTVQTWRVLALRNYPFIYVLNNHKTHEMTADRRVKKFSVLCRSWHSITPHSEPPLRTVSYHELVTQRRSVLILSSHVWLGLKCSLQLQLCFHIPSVTRAVCTIPPQTRTLRYSVAQCCSSEN